MDIQNIKLRRQSAESWRKNIQGRWKKLRRLLRTVTLAFLVTEDELPYLYLDLFSLNEDYTQFCQSALLYGYVDIRQ